MAEALAVLDRMEARLARLDARRKAAPGQLGLGLAGTGPGGGQPCGQAWIDPNYTCHVGAGAGQAAAGSGAQGGATVPRAGTQAAAEDRPHEARRGRPAERIVFPEPITGASGATLTAYSWQWTLTEDMDSHGEVVERRVSDWSKAVENIETGRNVVHQFEVQANGETRLVSAETALSLLGFTDPADRKRFGSMKTTARTIARLRMATQEAERQAQRWEQDMAAVEQMPRPPAEAGDWSSSREGRRDRTWTMGATTFREIEFGGHRNFADEEAIRWLTRDWTNEQMEARGWPYTLRTRSSGTQKLQTERRDLQRRLERAQQRLPQRPTLDSRCMNARLDYTGAQIEAMARAREGLHGSGGKIPTKEQFIRQGRPAPARRGLPPVKGSTAGGGQPCGRAWIDPNYTCHVGAGAGQAAASVPSAGSSEPKPDLRPTLSMATSLDTFLNIYQRGGSDFTRPRRQEIIDYAKERDLSDWELSAVVQFTRTSHRDVNAALRGLDPPRGGMKPDEGRVHAALISSALEKLPEWRGTVWRGVNMDPEHLAEFRVGRVGGDLGFQSTTAESPFGSIGADGVARSFAEGDLDVPRPGRVIVEFAPGHGARSIAKLSSADEQEALIPPGRQFRVAAVSSFADELERRKGEREKWAEGITLIRLEAVGQRLDAEGQPCGESFISSSYTCRVGRNQGRSSELELGIDDPNEPHKGEMIKAIQSYTLASAAIKRQQAKRAQAQGYVLTRHGFNEANELPLIPPSPVELKTRDTHVDALERFIAKAPKYDGDVYRGIRFSGGPEGLTAFLEDLNGFTFSATVESWTADRDKVKPFAGTDETALATAPSMNVSVILRQRNVHGASIAGYSDVPFEQEVLQPAGICYQATMIRETKVTHLPDGSRLPAPKWIFEVEVEPIEHRPFRTKQITLDSLEARLGRLLRGDGGIGGADHLHALRLQPSQDLIHGATLRGGGARLPRQDHAVAEAVGVSHRDPARQDQATPGAIDALEQRLARLDARVKQAPDQMGRGQAGAGTGPGGGQPCGRAWIDPNYTCHKGGGGEAPAAAGLNRVLQIRQELQARRERQAQELQAGQAAPSTGLHISLPDFDTGAPLLGGKPPEKALGGGAYGNTYLYRGEDDRMVVVKVDRLGNQDPKERDWDRPKEEQRWNMVTREQEAMARAHELGLGPEPLSSVQKLADGRLAFAYEFTEGQPVWKDHGSPQPTPAAFEILQQPGVRATVAQEVARIARTVSASGFEHADLHGGNVVLGTDGKLTLIDWGMSSQSDVADAARQAVLEVRTIDTLGDWLTVNGPIDQRGSGGAVKDPISGRIGPQPLDQFRTKAYEALKAEEAVIKAYRDTWHADPQNDLPNPMKALTEANRLAREEGIPYQEAEVMVGVEPRIPEAVKAYAATARESVFGARQLRMLRRLVDNHYAAWERYSPA